MTVAELISPPLSEKSPLGSLSGWSFVVRCPRCGEKSKPVEKIATTPSLYARSIGPIIAKFTCSACGARPIKVEAECVWAKAALPPNTRIDLTWLLPPAPPAPQDAPVAQPSLL